MTYGKKKKKMICCFWYFSLAMAMCVWSLPFLDISQSLQIPIYLSIYLYLSLYLSCSSHGEVHLFAVDFVAASQPVRNRRVTRRRPPRHGAKAVQHMAHRRDIARHLRRARTVFGECGGQMSEERKGTGKDNRATPHDVEKKKEEKRKKKKHSPNHTHVASISRRTCADVRTTGPAPTVMIRTDVAVRRSWWVGHCSGAH
jgi:hypothetical protein